MKISLVIPSYERAERLAETLSAAGNQTILPDEIIVADDGSSRESFLIKQRLCSTTPVLCKLITQQNSGASSALNNGIRRSSGELIIIIDDDIILERDAIEKHLSFQNEFGPCIVSGDARTDESRAATDVEKYKLYMEKEWLKKRPDTAHRLKVDYNNFIVTTANTSFTREIFNRIGGFDESLRDGYDVDFAVRALMLNIPVWFDRYIRSIHNDRITLRYYARRQMLYNRSKRLIVEKHPELESVLPVNAGSKGGIFRKLIYGILRKDNIVNFIERSRMMLLLPRKLRYRIYGSTIAALCG